MKTAFWNIVFGVFFAGLVLYGAYYLQDQGYLTHAVSIGDFILMTLAIFRLTRLVTYDVILKFFRDFVAEAPSDSFLGTLSALVHCPWCTGLWFSLAVVFAFYVVPFAGPVILILALAGLASLFQVLANLLGWSAEGKKRDVLGMASESRTTCG